MRLTTAGKPSSLAKAAVVGKVTWKHLPNNLRTNHILVSNEEKYSNSDLIGYAGFLTTADGDDVEVSSPKIYSLQHVDHFRDGDIVAIEPTNGFVRTLYRPDSDYNVIFATHRCNSNCLMCSQPPLDRDDVEALTKRNLSLIKLIDSAPKRLVITGGEPTILRNHLWDIIESLRDKFPTTYLHMLTNGRSFAWAANAARLAEIEYPDLMLGIPLYSDDSTVHDYVVQARGAFDQTVMGFHQLARFGVRIEIRVVLHAITIPRLVQLAEYIYRNFPFVQHVALMGMENIGFASRNMQSLWIDPFDYQDELESAVEILATRGLTVSIYNHQLCVLRKPLWKFARKSISDWKNIYIDECATCAIKNDCGGFFAWASKQHSKYIKPLNGSIS